MISTIELTDQGSALVYTFDDVMLYHGPGSPGGVAHAVKVMERVLPLLEPGGLPERREIEVHTAFAGRCVRDGHPRGDRGPVRRRRCVSASRTGSDARALRFPARLPRTKRDGGSS